MPPAELSLLRNGSLGSVHSTIEPGDPPLPLISVNSGSTADIEATFSLYRNSRGASFGLAVFCPPHVATHDGLSMCTRITLNVSELASVASRNDNNVLAPVRNFSMSIAVPTTPYVNATSATSAWFALPSVNTDAPVEVHLRVLTDRSIVEAFGADGLVSVSVLTFPAFGDTAAFAFAHVESGSVSINSSIHSMGCQWLTE
jgi:hypothetical protein